MKLHSISSSFLRFVGLVMIVSVTLGFRFPSRVPTESSLPSGDDIPDSILERSKRCLFYF